MATQHTSAADRVLMSRIIWRLLPLLVACLVVQSIDKGNIGFAKLGMLSDLGFSEAVLGFGSSLFYVGYLLFEVPSSIANYHYGARLWFARIMLTWAITTLLLAATQSAVMFYILRFALGAAEAGLYPSLIFFLTLWFPESERARVMGYLTLGSALGNGLSAMISGSLLDIDGAMSLAGWQWIFLVTGILPLVTMVLVLRYLPSRPEEATFLAPDERRRVDELVAASAGPSRHGGMGTLLANPLVIGFGLIYAILLGSLYGINYWMPTVLHEFDVSGRLNGVIIAIPWVLDVLLLVTVMPRLRSARSVIGGLFVLSLIAILSFAAAASGGGLAFKGVAIMLGIPAISLCIACFWTIPVRYFTGAQAA
ncbi:MAG TPA: MFS transporter, partial [Croceibacterium sp.]|nr:MFS transporter [Croceibacterium sp.]